MRILVFGADGFVGRNVCRELEDSHEVFRASQRDVEAKEERVVQVDLLSGFSVANALKITQPDIIVNCAGVVDASQDVNQNVQFTDNILRQAVEFGGVKRVIVSGSAGEYGVVDPSDIPVTEHAPLRANQGYGYAKAEEERLALKYQQEYKIGVVVLRIFNPIGPGMADKFLLTRLMRQVEECRRGEREEIEISRLDSERDYVAIEDVATAFRAVIEGEPRQGIYNVGSGISISNGELLELILNNSRIDSRPSVRETADVPEPLFAVQANIERISNEFGWYPEHKIDDVVRKIVNGKDEN